VLVYILSFLRTSDRKEASLVCSRWYEASQDLQFQRKVIFCIPASASSLELIRALGRRSVCRLSIRQLDGFGVSRLLLQEVGVCLGPRLESLALPGSSLTEASLLGLLPRLTSLRRLDLRGLDSLFMSGAFLSWEEHRQQVLTPPSIFHSWAQIHLQSRTPPLLPPPGPQGAALCGLEELDLSDLRYLSDLTFNRLTSCTPRLRRLALAGCHITFEFDPYRGRPAGAAEDSSALLSLRNLRRLLAEQKASLVALDLSRTSISPQSLCSIAQVQGLVLEELLLQGCKELTDYAVEALVEHQPRLRCLDLSGCPELRSRSAEAAAGGLAGPARLSLSGDWRITEKGLADLLAVRTLRSLDLSGCPRVSGAEMAKGLKGSGGAAGAPLESLNLNGCICIRDSAVLALARLLGASLRELDLTSCVHLTDLSVRSITTHLRKLAVLRLARCPEITDRGLLGMAEAPKNSSDQEMGDGGPRFTGTSGLMGFIKPPRLPFQERPQVAAPPDPDPSRRPLGVSLLALRRLQELDLSACPRLSDGSIAQVRLGGVGAGGATAGRGSSRSPSGGVAPGAPAPVPVGAERHHRRQPGGGGAALPEPQQPGPPPLPRHQRPRRGPGRAPPAPPAAPLPLRLPQRDRQASPRRRLLPSPSL
ncbi:unnamed protein product, partial [Tetraodon nigroviridis]